MEMIKVHRCNQVITPRNQHILDLAVMLSIGTECLYSDDQYIYLDFLSAPSVHMAISSQLDVHASDVVIPEEIFTEILIDVASGILINDAMIKHNILLSY